MVDTGGEGPGEYSSISRIDTGPRYIHVFEYHQSRTVLDHDFNYGSHKWIALEPGRTPGS